MSTGTLTCRLNVDFANINICILIRYYQCSFQFLVFCH